jgi:hypothetical protein
LTYLHPDKFGVTVTDNLQYHGQSFDTGNIRPNSEQSYKGKVKTHNYINRQNHERLSNITLVTQIKVNDTVFFLLLFMFDNFR